MFSNDLTKALAVTTIGTLLLDTTAFRDKLDNMGYIFNPTTGIMNNSNVRMRENPNLQAQSLGYLQKGDKVEILDRSGIKVQIGNMNDWWYKVRTEDGTEAWAYGYFIDVEETP